MDTADFQGLKIDLNEIQKFDKNNNVEPIYTNERGELKINDQQEQEIEAVPKQKPIPTAIFGNTNRKQSKDRYFPESHMKMNEDLNVDPIDGSLDLNQSFSKQLNLGV